MSSKRQFVKDESSFSGSYSREVFLAVLLAYRPWLKRVIAILILGLAGRALLLSNTNLMGLWVDSLCEGTGCKPQPAFLRGFTHHDFALLLIGITLVGFVFNTAFRILISRIGTHAVSRFYDEVTLRTSRFPMTFFDSNPVGRMITRFGSDYGAIFRMSGGPMGEFLCLTFDLALMLVLTTVASPWYLPLVIASLLINSFVYRKNLMRMRAERRQLSRARSPAIAHFSETVQGARIIKAFGRESVFLNRFTHLVEELVLQRLRTTAVVSFFSVQMSASTASLLLLTGVFGLTLVAKGIVSVGSLAVAFTFVMMSSTTFQSFFDWLSSLEDALTGVERMNEYLRHDIEPHATLPSEALYQTGHRIEVAADSCQQATHALRTATNAAVEIDGLSMRYRADFPLVLDNISFRVEAGEQIGIIGRTGSGKSSLIQAMFHLYPFERGTVRIGGYDVQASPQSADCIDLGLYRSAIALISQDPLLFTGTLRENLSFEGQLRDADLLDLLKTVGLDEFMATLGAKPLDLRIEERGTNLSMGQRQLICLARCLLQNAPVVIMDEATSAVDPVSERLLIETTERHLANKTRIIVAHRLATVASCNRIIWLEHGRIRMQGEAGRILEAFEQTESGARHA
jgi:ABC-type multidrug transport system fused ATPase/permease subunit